MNSLYGGLKASQEADNIFIIQRKYFRFKETYFEKFLQVIELIHIDKHIYIVYYSMRVYFVEIRFGKIVTLVKCCWENDCKCILTPKVNAIGW